MMYGQILIQKQVHTCRPNPILSVAAKFEYTAYSKLAAGKISNIGIFEYTCVYSNIHGHFVAKY